MCNAIGIMQPYFFPYIGYYQHLDVCDKFVFLDDVEYANLEYVRRNNLLVNGRRQPFGLEMVSKSQMTLIRDLQLSPDPRWRSRMLKTIERNYRRSPGYDEVMETVIRPVIQSNVSTVAELNKLSIMISSEFVGITTIVCETSANYENRHLAGATRIRDICRLEGATTYINPIGGTKLYFHDDFEADGLQLKFHKSDMTAMKYVQGNAPWTPYLSIIDVLMWNDRGHRAGFSSLFRSCARRLRRRVDRPAARIRVCHDATNCHRYSQLSKIRINLALKHLQ